jgi:Lipase (class 3)
MQHLVKLRQLPFAIAALALSACVPQPVVPPHQVPTPAVESAGIQALVQTQYTVLNQTACLSEAAYFSNPPGQNAPSPGCSQWENPPVRMEYRPIMLTDIWGNSYPGQYWVIIDDVHRQQIIAIRGTADPADWLTDIRFIPVYDDILKVTVHRGFQTYARSVLTDLFDPKHPLNPNYDTYVTGHSLGGAAAVLVGLYLHVGYPSINVKGVYTYGQPKVFDNFGATSWPIFFNKIYHVENCYDPVALVPIADSFLGSLIVHPLSLRDETSQYEHVGHEILLLGRQKYWVPGANEVDRGAVSEVKAALAALKAKQDTDHAISLYISRLQALNSGNGAVFPPTNPAYQFNETCAYHLQPS